MIRANSLIYAIYICLIVGILCGALLLVGSLHERLNVFYGLQSELYLDNLSTTNFALGNNLEPVDVPEQEDGIRSEYTTRMHGLIEVLEVRSIRDRDTVASAYLTGRRDDSPLALYTADFSDMLNLTGNVKVSGDMKLPLGRTKQANINHQKNEIDLSGKVMPSDRFLPELADKCAAFYEESRTWTSQPLSNVPKTGDLLYYHSFESPRLTVLLPSPLLQKAIFRGNYALVARDSIVVDASTVLEDVLLIAPKIVIGDNFRGTVQAFATRSIRVGKEVRLDYPSVLCVRNTGKEKMQIETGDGFSVKGLVVVTGNDFLNVDKARILFADDARITGTVYCSGTLIAKGKINGTVYASRLAYAFGGTDWLNCLGDIEIDARKPKQFLDIPVFSGQNHAYGIIKKVL
ncbi:hypothetical protein HUK80_00010 [Flavobacterium sp. MAH-1]|uniref:Polymer-forming cytoskeletal protein n=1 Tax=Flavobacterium agri TaxID=2743471 RepID=A0A7Y8XZQ1_9FLAO|nr:hypothetical protein [Flavobacterium agri]NUY79259.1 hypothetical protein [Flavobacterium agri]NYA69283.1 hypothetical protein [Flavobacterium agri]